MASTNESNTAVIKEGRFTDAECEGTTLLMEISV